MRIAIDFTSFIPQMTGVDRYLKEMVLHLAAIDPTNQYRIFQNREDRALLGSLPANFSLASRCLRPRFVRLLFQQILLPLAARSWRADVVHSPSFMMPYVRGSARHVLTVHDMTSFSHPHCHNGLRRSLMYRRMVLLSLRRTDIVVAISQATRQAILQFVPELRPDRIRVTVPGIGPEFQPCHPSRIREVVTRLGLSQPYVLFVGTLEPRKNLPALIEGYRQFIAGGERPEHLVLAGKLGWDYEGLLTQIRAPGLRGRVHLAGYLDPRDLPAVYAGARLMAYPSLHEGFGFPPLEAMACGVPVVSTLTSSLVENLRGAAELVPPNDVTALVEALHRLLTDEDLRARRVIQGLERASRFRWDETARQTVSSYEAAMAMGRRDGAPEPGPRQPFV